MINLGDKLLDPRLLVTAQEMRRALSSASLQAPLTTMLFDIDRLVFEILTVEFVEALGNYLSNQAAALGSNFVLEVGAGDGRLAWFLNKFFAGNGHNLKIVPTDSFDLPMKERFSVEKLSCEQALDRYEPAIILSSWMPHNVDWTPLFRQLKTTSEYILVGVDNGCSGSSETWKKHPGFNSIDITSVARHQLCRDDLIADVHLNHSRSRCVSFRRQIKSNRRQACRGGPSLAQRT